MAGERVFYVTKMKRSNLYEVQDDKGNRLYFRHEGDNKLVKGFRTVKATAKAIAEAFGSATLMRP